MICMYVGQVPDGSVQVSVRDETSFDRNYSLGKQVNVYI